ncbi:hypothetical protein SAMN05660236_4490 [Ohtaekwangia koreensis]|uniref:Uncharacterized protein n=1 Tax=Ohtaekwangia koreensis TaxID=688867 RepID=A0A1T5M5U2_9BACT|nr:hypothetical protein SAMN05660236_4490 [Ohtaekwangia koreensis]
MLHLKQTLLHQIKSATNEREIEIIICHTIYHLRAKGIPADIIFRFIIGMNKNLARVLKEVDSNREEKNITVAIMVLRKIQKPQD